MRMTNDDECSRGYCFPLIAVMILRDEMLSR